MSVVPLDDLINTQICSALFPKLNTTYVLCFIIYTMWRSKVTNQPSMCRKSRGKHLRSEVRRDPRNGYLGLI